MDSVEAIAFGDVEAAALRIREHTRPLAVVATDRAGMVPGDAAVWLALEFLQHTGTFKARGAANFLAAHIEDHTLAQPG